MPKNNYENLTDLFSEADKKNPDKIAKGRADKYRGITSNIKAEEDFIKSSTDMKVVSKFLKTNQDDIEYRAAEEYAARQEALTGKRTLKGFKNTRGKHSVFSKVGGKESKRDKTMLNMVDNRRKTRDGEIAAFKEQASDPKEATATPAAATPAPVEAPAPVETPATAQTPAPVEAPTTSQAPAATPAPEQAPAPEEPKPQFSSFSNEVSYDEEQKYGKMKPREIRYFRMAMDSPRDFESTLRVRKMNPFEFSDWFKILCNENPQMQDAYEECKDIRGWRKQKKTTAGTSKPTAAPAAKPAEAPKTDPNARFKQQNDSLKELGMNVVDYGDYDGNLSKQMQSKAQAWVDEKYGNINEKAREALYDEWDSHLDDEKPEYPL